MTDSSGTTETVPGHDGTLTWTDADGDTLDVDVRRDGKYPDHIGVTTSSRNGALLDKHQVENLRDCLTAWLGQGKDDQQAAWYEKGWKAAREYSAQEQAFTTPPPERPALVLAQGDEPDPLTVRVTSGHGPALLYVNEQGTPHRLDAAAPDPLPYETTQVWQGLTARDLHLLRGLLRSTGLPQHFLERGL